MSKRYQVFKEKATGKVAAVYDNCRTESPRFKNIDLYEEIITNQKRVIDSSFTLSAPKQYRVYIKKVITTKRIIYIGETLLVDLTLKEISTLEDEGMKVEEWR